MARKQARRRKQKPARRFTLPKMPRFPVRGAGVLLFAIAIVLLTYRFSAALLDRPISSITIEGPFERVSALQIEEAIGDEIQAGFFTADLELIRTRVMALTWIDEASVARRWPGTLAISVTEQVPAATWGERGLLNTRGELFVTDARHVPAELPRLHGPEDQSGKVAERYLDMREQLIPSGLDLREVVLDARGAWSMQLTNGVEIRFGRRDIETRARLFVDVVANIVASREAEIEFVDMRYGNGFTIGWKDAARAPAGDKPLSEGGLVAGLAN